MKAESQENRHDASGESADDGQSPIRVSLTGVAADNVSGLGTEHVQQFLNLRGVLHVLDVQGSVHQRLLLAGLGPSSGFGTPSVLILA